MAKKEEMTQKKTSHIAPFGLRMQPELREQIEGSARDSGRSMNAEIVHRLEESFALDEGKATGRLSAVLKHFLSGMTKQDMIDATKPEEDVDFLDIPMFMRKQAIKEAEEGSDPILTSSEAHSINNRLEGLESDIKEMNSHFGDFMKAVLKELKDLKSD